MPSIDRRRFIAATTAALAAPSLARAQAPVIIKMGALKLIHSIAPYFYEKFTPAGYKIEVIPFESPTEGKNAVVTKSVDFGMFGIAAAIFGAAASEPMRSSPAPATGMAVIAKIRPRSPSIKDLKGKRVGYLARVDARGLYPRAPAHGRHAGQRYRRRSASPSARCISRLRSATSTPTSAPSRDPACDPPSGVGKLIEYPYRTHDGHPQHGVRRPSRDRHREARPRAKLSSRSTARPPSSPWRIRPR